MYWYVLSLITQVDKAMQQIFGRKLLARDLITAGRFSESCDMDAVTMEGDEANRKGSMQGGFHDEKNQKLAHVATIRVASAEVRRVDTYQKDIVNAKTCHHFKKQPLI